MAGDGLATGNVRFDGEGTAGEAADAAFVGNVAGGTVTLRASGDRRARLASGRTRVAAQTIVRRRSRREAHGGRAGRIDMLPAPRNQPSGMSPMFTATEAVHFVSASLESESGGARLLLRGDVRAWQGERSLAADAGREMVREGEVMNARGHVATRMPRDAARTATEADYIQVGAADADHESEGPTPRTRKKCLEDIAKPVQSCYNKRPILLLIWSGLFVWRPLWDTSPNNFRTTRQADYQRKGR